MQHLDCDYIERLMERLNGIPADATPQWGTLTPGSLIEHFIWVMRHSMGRSNQVPFLGNWMTKTLIKPLILYGLAPIPKNLRIPKHLATQGVTLREPGDLETLHALLDEYVHLVQAGELHPAPHPAFGDIGVDGWDRMHIRHFEHHCRQFGV